MKVGDFGSNPNNSVHTIRSPDTAARARAIDFLISEKGSRSLFQSISTGEPISARGTEHHCSDRHRARHESQDLQTKIGERRSRVQVDPGCAKTRKKRVWPGCRKT